MPTSVLKLVRQFWKKPSAATLAPLRGDTQIDRAHAQLRRSLLVLAIFGFVSTAGFYVIGGHDREILHAIYLTAAIFSTVGAFNERNDTAQEVWAIFMMVFGIGAAVYAFGSVMAVLTSGEIQRMLGRRQLAGKIESIEDHYIVCGFGRMGRRICEALERAGVDFVIVESEADVTAVAESKGYLYLLGDAANEQVLKTAGIDRAKGLVTCLPHDADNVFATLTARDLNSRITIIARAERQETEPRLQRAGANRVICPPVIGAIKITRMLLHPVAEDLLDATVAGDLTIDRIAVSGMGDLKGKTLREAALPTHFGIMVLAIERPDGHRVFNPAADHTLEDGEQLVVIGPSESIDSLLNAYESANE